MLFFLPLISLSKSLSIIVDSIMLICDSISLCFVFNVVRVCVSCNVSIFFSRVTCFCINFTFKAWFVKYCCASCVDCFFVSVVVCSGCLMFCIFLKLMSNSLSKLSILVLVLRAFTVASISCIFAIRVVFDSCKFCNCVEFFSNVSFVPFVPFEVFCDSKCVISFSIFLIFSFCTLMY